ncbi:MAG TPA: LysR family transcriptional regulator [Albitalea sp.]|nr:LysR family transcriptional regulator [Albitalea sp.]
MNHLDPLWLHSFTAIVDAGAVARAAQRVHRTPSAVSTHLRQLEAVLGAQLIERTTRSMRLTAEGERFLPYARRLLELQDAAREALRPAREAPVWRVGASEYFMPARLAEMLSVFEREADGARLELLWASSAQLQRLWAAGEVDLAVVTSAVPLREARLLRREPLAWVAAPGHVPAADRPTPLVLLGPECPVREIALAALARTGHPHHVRLSCGGSQAAVAAVRAGWGVGCLNASAIPADLLRLARDDPRRWASPGRLAFYLLAKPAMGPAAKALADWSASLH